MLKKTLSILSIIFLSSCSPSHEAYKSKGELCDDREALREITYNVGQVDRAGGVNVSIDRGIVQLSGFVESDAIKRGVMLETLKTKNVKDVIDNVIVRSNPSYRGERAVAASLDVK